MFKSVMNLLFQIDAVIFEHWATQILLLILGIVAVLAPYPYLNYWVYAGIVVYVSLIVYRFKISGFKEESKKLKQEYKEFGLFPFVKGFTYALLLGPLGLVLAFALSLWAKEASKK